MCPAEHRKSDWDSLEAAAMSCQMNYSKLQHVKTRTWDQQLNNPISQDNTGSYVRVTSESFLHSTGIHHSLHLLSGVTMAEGLLTLEVHNIFTQYIIWLNTGLEIKV